jgi:MarR family transcriptional regulator, transcriptional regulator for hemolysin
MRKAFDRQVAELGVTRSQWTLIAVVARNPGTTQRSVARTLEISEASAGRLIDRLCADGLLERRAKEADRRAHLVYLTGKASPMLTRLEQIGRRFDEELFAGIGDEELAQFRAVLDAICRNVSEPDEKDPML